MSRVGDFYLFHASHIFLNCGFVFVLVKAKYQKRNETCWGVFIPRCCPSRFLIWELTPSSELLVDGISGLSRWTKKGCQSSVSSLQALLKFPWVYHHFLPVSELTVFSLSRWPNTLSHSIKSASQLLFSSFVLMWGNCLAILLKTFVSKKELFCGRSLLASLTTWARQRWWGTRGRKPDTTRYSSTTRRCFLCEWCPCKS